MYENSIRKLVIYRVRCPSKLVISSAMPKTDIYLYTNKITMNALGSPQRLSIYT